MIQTVNKKIKYKYIIGSIILIFGLISIIYYSQKKTDVYIIYDDNFSNCTNVKEFYKKMFFVVCDGDKTILFSKLENIPSNTQNSSVLKRLNILSKKELFDQFEDSIKFANKNYLKINEPKKINFYIIIKDDSNSLIEIIPVGKTRVFS
ncbi:hypothetical protein SAMN06265371_106232 [Lutibacter agarilyticus]|uniref:Uncharacterized protein n=1 Tax=Lutibacter agarilyticus TaxID=1109740 RepID=A0A238XQK8_9FLAO|nr:hypothetical protein [Lutibacter agarilyticus]SNR61000.1 hypothetical protein SAMN06265371_106232 [Lutibacter agarilyticus]